MQKFVFVNRRRGADRRDQTDPCRHMPMDLFHRKRRKSPDRRHPSRSLTEDYYAYMQKSLDSVQSELVDTRKPTN